MQVRGLIWLGTRTDRFVEMVMFYEGVLGLSPTHRQEDFAVYDLPDGDRVELFGPGGHDHFDTGPVTGFGVDDVDAARVEMEASGVEFLGPTGGKPGGYRWAHFRAPDGSVYEIAGPPGEH